MQADYQSPLGKSQILEFGGKDILRRVNSDYTYFQATGAGGTFVPRTGAGPEQGFNYRQNVTAGYVAYTLGLPKGFTLKPGARYEYTSITADFRTGRAGRHSGLRRAGAQREPLAQAGQWQRGEAGLQPPHPAPFAAVPEPQHAGVNPLIAPRATPGWRPNTPTTTSWATARCLKKVNLNFSTFVRNTTGAIQSVRTPLLVA